MSNQCLTNVRPMSDQCQTNVTIVIATTSHVTPAHYKRDEFGQITRHKARLVARGFTQVYGLDYLDIFAPMAKLASLRIILAIAAAEDLELHQMDMVAAFLAEDLEEEIYLEQ